MAKDKSVPLGIGLLGGNVKVYNTIAEMQEDSKLKVGKVVEVLGYYQAGDGAGHKRVIADSDDGSGVQLGNGLWANIVHSGEVNVSWFGAKGDGVTDDTQAIQKAVNISDVVVFNEKTFKFQNVVINNKKITIKSKGNTKFISFIILNVEDGAYITEDGLEKGYLTTSSNMFKITNSNGVRFENISFTGYLNDTNKHSYVYSGNVATKEDIQSLLFIKDSSNVEFINCGLKEYVNSHEVPSGTSYKDLYDTIYTHAPIMINNCNNVKFDCFNENSVNSEAIKLLKCTNVIVTNSIFHNETGISYLDLWLCDNVNISKCFFKKDNSELLSSRGQELNIHSKNVIVSECIFDNAWVDVGTELRNAKVEEWNIFQVENIEICNCIFKKSSLSFVSIKEEKVTTNISEYGFKNISIRNNKFIDYKIREQSTIINVSNDALSKSDIVIIENNDFIIDTINDDFTSCVYLSTQNNMSVNQLLLEKVVISNNNFNSKNKNDYFIKMNKGEVQQLYVHNNTINGATLINGLSEELKIGFVSIKNNNIKQDTANISIQLFVSDNFNCQIVGNNISSYRQLKLSSSSTKNNVKININNNTFSEVDNDIDAGSFVIDFPYNQAKTNISIKCYDNIFNSKIVATKNENYIYIRGVEDIIFNFNIINFVRNFKMLFSINSEMKAYSNWEIKNNVDEKLTANCAYSYPPYTNRCYINHNSNTMRYNNTPTYAYQSDIFINDANVVYYENNGVFTQSITQLNTPYYTTKMEEEGGTTLTDYYSYLDEKYAYDKQIQEEEESKYEAYQQALTANPNLTYEEFIASYPSMISIIEEPTIPESVVKFMEKYLGTTPTQKNKNSFGSW